MRRRLRLLRSRTLLLWLALVLGLATALGVVFYATPLLSVEEVEVDGVEGALAESVLERADIPDGRPLARVWQSRVSSRVLEDLRIAAVEVERDWPSSVRLAVTEREPAVALRGSGSTWLADASGVVFVEDPDPSNKVPLIELRTDPQDLDRETVTGLVELWRLRPDPADLEGELTPPSVDRAGRIEMEIGQVTLRWGTPTDNELKWSVVSALIGQETIDPAGSAPVTIDVRLPHNPVVTGLPEAADGR